jgi:hypothetical protein
MNQQPDFPAAQDDSLGRLKIHSSRVSSSWELMQRLRGRCGKGNFKVEMQHNIYTIYIRKESAVDAEKLQVCLLGSRIGGEYWNRDDEDKAD